MTRGEATPYGDDAFFRQSLALLEDVATGLDRDAQFRGAWIRAEAAAHAVIDAMQAPAVAAENEPASRRRLWAALDELTTRTREIAPTYAREYPGPNLAAVLAARVLSHVYLKRGIPSDQVRQEISSLIRRLNLRIRGTEPRDLRMLLAVRQPRGAPARLPEWNKAELLERVAKAARELKRNGGADNVTLPNVGGLIGVPERTLRKWLRRYGENPRTLMRTLRIGP